MAFQNYLLSDEVQNEIQRTGRRTGFEGVADQNRDVFKAEWGIDVDTILSPITMPSAEVTLEALNLYQTEFRKPPLTVYVLDFSGSMMGKEKVNLRRKWTSSSTRLKPGNTSCKQTAGK